MSLFSNTERKLAEARLTLADTNRSARERGQAAQEMCRIDYEKARVLLENLPLKTRRLVKATTVSDFELDIDRYLRHWVAAVAPCLGLDTETLSWLYQDCTPQWSLALPPGYSTYRCPSAVPTEDQWLTLPSPTRPNRQKLRQGDVISVKGETGFRVVALDMAKPGPDEHVSYTELGYRLHNFYPPQTIAYRRDVTLKHELTAAQHDPRTLFADFLERRRQAPASQAE